MKLIIDIPEQWRDDMVWENFDKVDELCQAILDGDIISDNATVCDIEQIRDEIEESITDYILDEEDTNTAIRMGDVMTKVFDIIDKYK